MATQLTDIELDEVSLVDKGANQEAHVVIVKRSPLRRFTDWLLNKNYDVMTPQPMSAVIANAEAMANVERLMMALHESLESIAGSDLEPEDKLALMQQSAAEFAEATSEIEIMKSLRETVEAMSSLDDIPSALAEITKALGDEGEAQGEDMTEQVKAEPSSVDVEKSDEVQKALKSEIEKREALEKRLAEMERVAKRAEVQTRVEKSMGAIPGASASDLVEVLMAVADGAGIEVASKVEAMLTASSAAIAESVVLDEVGKAAGAEVDAMSRARAIADEMRKENPKMSKEVALAKAFEQNPELAAAHYGK